MNRPNIIVVVEGGCVTGVHLHDAALGPLTYSVVDWDNLRGAEHPDDLLLPVVLHPLPCDPWTVKDTTALRGELADLRNKLVDDLVEQTKVGAR